jgi:hypothetical protein
MAAIASGLAPEALLTDFSAQPFSNHTDSSAVIISLAGRRFFIWFAPVGVIYRLIFSMGLLRIVIIIGATEPSTAAVLGQVAVFNPLGIVVILISPLSAVAPAG